MKEEDGGERLAAMVHSYNMNNAETFEEESDSDEEDVRMGAMVHRVGEDIEVCANIDYEKRFSDIGHSQKSSYAICDSGADLCIVSSMAKIEEVTNRTANLSGYDPNSTRSNGLPTVTALIKTLTKENIPDLLQLHEAVHNKNSTITLLSEYQVREYGIVVDSVAKKHLSTGGMHGTQTIYVSKGTECPLIYRGGLMGIQVYPIEDGDEDIYEIINMTSSKPWIPKSHTHIPIEVNSVLVNKSLNNYKSMGLMDSGANTSLIGPEFFIQRFDEKRVVVEGFGGPFHAVRGMRMVVGITAVQSTENTILIRVNEAVLAEKTILSVNQIRSQGHTVDDVTIWYGGKQAIFIKGENIGIPLAYMGALMYLPIRKPTRNELTEGEVIDLTDGNIEWNPQRYETQDNLELWDNNISNFFNFNIRVTGMIKAPITINPKVNKN